MLMPISLCVVLCCTNQQTHLLFWPNKPHTPICRRFLHLSTISTLVLIQLDYICCAWEMTLEHWWGYSSPTYLSYHTLFQCSSFGHGNIWLPHILNPNISLHSYSQCTTSIAIFISNLNNRRHLKISYTSHMSMFHVGPINHIWSMRTIIKSQPINILWP